MPPSYPSTSSRLGTGLPSSPRPGLRSSTQKPRQYEKDSISPSVRPQDSTGSLARNERLQTLPRLPASLVSKEYQVSASSAKLQNTAQSRSHSREPPPSLPATPRSVSRVKRLELDEPFDSQVSSSSLSSASTSSSTSSLFVKPLSSGSSSRSSFDNAPEDGHPTSGLGNKYEDISHEPMQGEGWNIWGRVAEVAGNLTVNVSKAWATNVSIAAGEETPAGQESRLTRAMKSFHIAKAQEPSELPEWLFAPHERGKPPVDRPAENSAPADREDSPRGPGLRDVFDVASASFSSPSTSTLDRPALRDASSRPTKAADRLRAMRDAKRSALVAGSSTRSDTAMQGLTSSYNPSDAPATLTGSRRIGLPSGPALRRRS